MGDPARAQAKPSTDGPRNAAHHSRGRRQLRPRAQLNAAGTVTAEFVYANGTNVPDAILTGGKTYALLRDHLGSVRLVIDAQTGAIAQRLSYDAFGQVTEDTNPGFQPFGFAGGLYDPDTRLVHFGARDYDASIGRWVSKDPIGFDGGQANIYVYVGNDPANQVDPLGLFPGGAYGECMYDCLSQLLGTATLISGTAVAVLGTALTGGALGVVIGAPIGGVAAICNINCNQDPPPDCDASGQCCGGGGGASGAGGPQRDGTR